MYNRDGWPVWPSIYESQNKEALKQQKKLRKKAKKSGNHNPPPLPPHQNRQYGNNNQYGQIYGTNILPGFNEFEVPIRQ